LKYKMSFVALAMVLSTAASAQSVSLTYGYRDSDNGTTQTATGISARMKLFDNVDGDVGIANLQDRSNLTNGLRTELGLSYSKPLFSVFSGSVRLSHGFKSNSGKETIQYYNIEPSVTAKIPGTALSTRVGYRYRDTYSENDKDRSDTTRYAVMYDLTKKDRIAVSYDDQRGVGAAKQTSLVYTRSF
jgi:hypothetical protein